MNLEAPALHRDSSCRSGAFGEPEAVAALLRRRATIFIVVEHNKSNCDPVSFHSACVSGLLVVRKTTWSFISTPIVRITAPFSVSFSRQDVASTEEGKCSLRARSTDAEPNQVGAGQELLVQMKRSDAQHSTESGLRFLLCDEDGFF